MSRIVALFDMDANCCNCSVDHLVLPDDMDIYAEHRAYGGSQKTATGRPSFLAWLIRRGARLPSEDELLPHWV